MTAICVLHHVAPAEWAHFLSEMRRVVRPGGLICVIEHNPLNPLTRLAVSRCEFDRDAVLLGASTTRKLMAAGGLREIGSRYFLLLPWEAKPARRVELRFKQRAARRAIRRVWQRLSLLLRRQSSRLCTTATSSL